MRMLLLGTGTSHGVPVIGCGCPVCRSKNPHDRRYRCSALVTSASGHKILIDCGPEFRLQCIENGISAIDAVLLTHSHADHLHGIDDLRIFSVMLDHKPDSEDGQKRVDAPPLPIYANAQTIQDLKGRFAYIFGPAKEGGGIAKLRLIETDKGFFIGSARITPVPMEHGNTHTTGWLITEADSSGRAHSIAYLTDCNFISEQAFGLIQQDAGELDHLVIDGLRIKEHQTHFNIRQALQTADRLRPKHTWVTHLTHNSSHDEYSQYINEQLRDFPNLRAAAPGYDGLELLSE